MWKGKKRMEISYKADVILNDEKIYLKFDLQDENDYLIDFASEDQSALRKVFYKMIELSHDKLVKFELSPKTVDFQYCDLHREIAEAYLQELNKELQNVYDDINSNN